MVSNERTISVASDVEDDPVSLGTSFREMTKELIESRDLLWQLTVRDLKLRYKQAAMGVLWAIFMPMVIVGAGLFMRTLIARLSGTQVGVQDLGSVAVKSLVWSFFAGSMSFSVGSLTQNLPLVTKIYFPREVLPLSAVLTQLLDTAVGGGILLVALTLSGSVHWSWQMLWAVPTLGLLLLGVAGLALVDGGANLFYRDVKYIVQVVVSFGILFVPVFYEPALFGRAGWWLYINPLAVVMEGLRLSLIEGESLGSVSADWHPLLLVYALAVSLAVTLVGWLVFHRSESVFAERA
jgi:ABC-type polysaccharide/polyol phosphate export permease